MKIQARKGVFETNSSTVHTVTIFNEGTDYSQYVGKTFVLGKDIPQDILWGEHKRDPLYKMQQLWMSMVGSYNSIGGYFRDCQKVKDTFAKIGINIEFTTDPDDFDEWRYEDLDEIYTVLSDEDETINFVFNNDSWYDSYCDDCGEKDYYDEIKEGSKIYQDRR
jgi:hypothetical protein